jgi:hypothetical protein
MDVGDILLRIMAEVKIQCFTELTLSLLTCYLDDALQPILETLQINDSSNFDLTKVLFDLFIVAVLLDAGAGPQWKYSLDDDGTCYSRSEGLALATLEMFKQGAFSSNPSQQPLRVDGKAQF